ncbi:MAG: GAF domain-containing protein [Planctomycetes bacterium]|nr:GAF domain-containing protein [Planctomycetota bacterium]
MVDRIRITCLADFLRAHHDRIVRAWADEARKLAPAQALSRPALLDHVPRLLDRLAEQVARARDGGVPRTFADETPRTHADDRLGVGYDLDEVVAEYALLRRSIHELAGEAEAAATPAELTALNAALDQAISEAVERFAEARERTLTALDRVSAAALEQDDIGAFLPQLLRVLVDSTEAVDVAALFLREGDHLHLRASLGLEDDLATGFTVKLGEGFVGGVAAAARPLLLHDAANDARVLSAALKRRGVRALYGVPLMRRGEVIGVAHVGSSRAGDFSPADKQLLHAMAQRAAALIEQQLAREALEAAHRRLAFLAEASQVLSASLRVEDVLDALARLTVPTIADWCAIDLLDEEGALVRAGLAHVDPARARLVRLIDARPGTRRRGDAGPARVAREGRPELHVDVDDALLRRLTDDPERLAALRSFGLRSILCLPLRGHGEVLGALTLATDVSGRRFGPEDVPAAEDLAGRVALAIENARLYEGARREVAAREAAEARARASEERVRQVADAVPAQVWMCDADGGLTYANHRWQEDTGVPLDRLAGWGWVDLIHPDDRARVLEGWREARDRGVDEYVLEARLRRADGAQRWHLVRGEPIRDAAGGIRAWVGANVDIDDMRRVEDERRRLLEALERALVARDRLSAAISHDVRGPLQSILLHADALARSLPTEQVRARQRAESIRVASQRIARLVDDLLNLAAIEEGRLTLERRREDARAILDEAVDVAGPLAAAGGLSLRAEADEDPGAVLCDRDQVARVLENLLGNAIKFTPAGGEVVAGVAPRGREVRFEVRDTGVGVPAEQRARIFERGVRLGPSGQSGLGLGLTIARAIVEAHGGRIGVEGRDGPGSAFWFTLPGA